MESAVQVKTSDWRKEAVMSEEGDFRGSFYEDGKKPTSNVFAWLFSLTLVAAVAVVGLWFNERMFARETARILERTENECAKFEAKSITLKEDVDWLNTQLSNKVSQIEAQGKVLAGERAAAMFFRQEAQRWQKESEKAVGAMLIAEKTERETKAKLVRLQKLFDDVKKDNDDLNRYLKGFKEATKAKLIEYDKKYITQQFELRKWKRNYETLRDCLLKKVEEKKSEQK